MPASQQPSARACGVKVVLDTNAVLDGWLFRDAAMVPVAQAIEEAAAQWLATPRMREELARALASPALARWNADSERTLSYFDRWAVLSAEPPLRPAGGMQCTDPDDQVFIELALAQRAQWLLTRDKALLRLARAASRLGTRVCVPASFTRA